MYPSALDCTCTVSVTQTQILYVSYDLRLTDGAPRPIFLTDFQHVKFAARTSYLFATPAASMNFERCNAFIARPPYNKRTVEDFQWIAPSKRLGDSSDIVYVRHASTTVCATRAASMSNASHKRHVPAWSLVHTWSVA